VDRLHFDFKEDEQIPEQLRATLADYKGSGFDRGHQAPAANHRSNPKAMADTFYLTNMCPQCPKFNRGYWARLEKHIRDLTKNYQNVYVVTGPLYLPYEEGNKRFVKYQVIGPNDIAVPTHFFKVITLEDLQGRKEMNAYILPNAEIPSNAPLHQFETTIQKIEKTAGLILSQ
jgi:endonuclease G, mitochondrial